MKLRINKSVMATAVAAALCAPIASFAGPVLIDRDGTGGTGTITVDSLNWAGSNMLFQDLIKSATILGVEVASRTGEFTLYAQGNLGSFSSGSAGLGCNGTTCGVINEWTYQLGITMTIDSELGTTAIVLSGGMAAAPTVNFFNIYYDPANDATHLPGTGFDGGLGVGATLVLSGTITDAQGGTTVQIPMNHDTSSNASSTTSALRRLDNFGLDQYSAIGTYVSNGNTQLDIAVTSQNAAFILTPLTMLTVGMNLATGGGTLPFSQVNPSAAVVGEAPNYGLTTNTQTGFFRFTGGSGVSQSRVMNDLFCGVGAELSSTTCDLHAQGQGTSAFFATSLPEPGTVALLGLGLGAFGFSMRRRKNQA